MFQEVGTWLLVKSQKAVLSKAGRLVFEVRDGLCQVGGLISLSPTLSLVLGRVKFFCHALEEEETSKPLCCLCGLPIVDASLSLTTEASLEARIQLARTFLEPGDPTTACSRDRYGALAVGSPFGLCSCLVPSPVFFLWTGAAKMAPRMLRGFQCVEHSQPWTAALFDGWKFHCTGTLINKQWLVTAAQCYTGRFLYVSLGEHNLMHFELTRQVKIATKTIRHPFYDSYSKDNDIMLVKLLTPVLITKDVKPIALPSSCPAPGSYCVLVGWGNTFMQKGYPPGILHCGNITTLSDRECLDVYPTVLLRHMLCATVKAGGSDSCQGDPGSPLVCDNELQGIASWGFEECSELKSPSVFVKVCNYINWLEETISSA
ncbi:hypothetical protein lerEdw1_005726 [Lerista edwardsae]|nr:hypothetical protein lerEdw1_005726 [Lerista edwardsae]